MTGKIIGYKMLMGDVIELNKRTALLIENGWQPYGDPFCQPIKLVSSCCADICQAMVQYEEEEVVKGDYNCGEDC